MALLTRARQVVGGGNAGNTIAARLALDSANFTVAVIDAGGFYELTEGNRSQIPGYNYINTLSVLPGHYSFCSEHSLTYRLVANFPLAMSTLSQISLTELNRKGHVISHRDEKEYILT